ncbi:MAG: response regulator [Candidatus Binataceae bacterium]
MPSLILLDLMMPKMDGRQFREEQKKDPDLARIPIIAISGVKASSRDMTELNAAGYVRKPLSITKLLEVIEQVLCGQQ